MKNRNCPNKDACWDYDAGNCEGCAIGEKIARLVCQNKKLKAKNAALRERLEKAIEVPFVVIDKTTGKEANLSEIALREKWAKNLIYCDMDGVAVTQDGALLILDECGRFEYCPSDRFEIISENSAKARLKELKEKNND